LRTRRTIPWRFWFRPVFGDLAKEQAFTDPYLATVQQLRAGGVRETLHSLLRFAEED
jgi:hypothetical protein